MRIDQRFLDQHDREEEESQLPDFRPEKPMEYPYNYNYEPFMQKQQYNEKSVAQELDNFNSISG